MGYISSSLTLLPPATVCSAGLTVAPAANQFAGSDYDRGVLRLNLTAQAGTWTTTGLVAVMIQSSPDAGVTWYPDAAATLAAAGYPAATTIPGYQALFTAGTTPVVGKYSTMMAGFPGNLCRVAVWVVTGTSVTLGITADLMKRVPDMS